jgi:cytochrome c oxidase cbb3-type subunit 3
MSGRIAIALALLGLSACVVGRHPYWTNRVPGAAQAAVNPYAGDAEAARAGAKLYAEYCASCHGRDAEGIGRKPALRSPVVRNASPGALFWLVTNGVIDKGMPPWAYLPEQQRWQLVTWLQHGSGR